MAISFLVYFFLVVVVGGLLFFFKRDMLFTYVSETSSKPNIQKLSDICCIISTTCISWSLCGILLKCQNLCHHFPIVEYFDFLIFFFCLSKHRCTYLLILDFQKCDYFSLWTYFYFLLYIDSLPKTSLHLLMNKLYSQIPIYPCLNQGHACVSKWSHVKGSCPLFLYSWEIEM